MKCIKKVALSEPLVGLVERRHIISNTCTFLDLDLYKVKPAELDFANTYELQIIRTDTVHALVCWFDAYFSKLNNPVHLSTSPYSRSTHWQQTVLYLNDPISVVTGRKLFGTIAIRKSKVHFRDLDIKVSYHYLEPAPGVNYTQMYKLR